MPYRIVRFYRDEDRPGEVVRRGVSLAQARSHCQREDSQGEDWWDGYEFEGESGPDEPWPVGD